MAKKAVVIIFLIMFASAATLFFMGKGGSLRPQEMSTKGSESRVNLENFALYRFAGGKPISMVSGKRAQLFEPNVLELEGEVYAERYRADGRLETAASERATAFFVADGLSQVLAGSELDRVLFDTDVKMLVRDMLLTTDAATYLAGSQLLTSSDPVEVRGESRQSFSDAGFKYELEIQRLRLLGNVNGVFSAPPP